jgi:MFS family permease
MSYRIPPEVALVGDTLRKAGFESYLVGGCVRDLILAREPKDWDIATNATPEQIQTVSRNSFYENDYGTVGVKTGSGDSRLAIVEVTPYRVESAYSDKRRPDTVAFGTSLLEDLARRDFTINAIALDESKGRLVDPYEGQKDIKDKLVRAVGEARDRFGEDALRMLRAIRLVAELNFGITVSAAGWIATAYILANAIFVPIWGKLGDSIGRKKVYIIGFAIFILGSVLAGLAWNLPSMIVFRVIQAIAGSADYPTAMAILAVTFKEGKERAQALGIWSSSFAAASVFGPLLGGPLIDIFGWRSVFLINLPIGLIGIYMAMRYINESRSEMKNVHFDWWGALTLGGSLSALVLVLDKGMEWGWGSMASIVCYALTMVLFYVFIKIEQKTPEPIVDLRFFKIPAFVNTIINNFVIFMGMMGGLFLIPIFAQTFLGYNTTEAGYLFIPMAAALMMAAPLGGVLTGRVKAKNVIFASTIDAGCPEDII